MLGGVVCWCHDPRVPSGRAPPHRIGTGSSAQWASQWQHGALVWVRPTRTTARDDGRATQHAPEGDDDGGRTAHLIAGRYRLMNRIGSGGMGHVWLAWDERLNRAVAVKQLHSPVGLPEAEARVAHDRAMREARITARLHHPNAVPVFDVVDHEGQPCLVMQYLPSRSLQAVLTERGPLPAREVARIGSELAAALAAAHRADIVHRDVKPGNVLVADDGTARITDFGISHALGDASLTSTGMVTGTPAYLAPEVARGTSSSCRLGRLLARRDALCRRRGRSSVRHRRERRWRCCTGSPPARSPRRRTGR